MTAELQIEGDADRRGSRTLDRMITDGVCRSAWHAAESGSTNTRALEDCQAGLLAPERYPRVYLADVQTAGRGRQGRQWVSDRLNLAFSIAMEVPRDAGLLPITVGVAIAEAIEHEIAPTKVQLKWPNDVWIGGQKLAGILIERTSLAPDLAVIGIGINIGAAPELAVSLEAAAKRSFDRFAILETLVENVIERASQIDDDVIGEFQSRCLLTGKTIRFQQSGHAFAGDCLGVDELGRLKVTTPAGPTTIESGEVSLVRF